MSLTDPEIFLKPGPLPARFAAFLERDMSFVCQLPLDFAGAATPGAAS